ncbi:transmembrane protein, putative (macronuclear) [Tetrahymena thermophila SB210]|uniref:Transmembrane protein, putative n=1 Tax=Tetrahymena thermophila (strain SB210) TaxID=312017 RepID=W7XJC7_TETTS|nr:transmembrane protein, putative [Tetrahymena thermophila SB210]EWS75411.1 transmembrane protein, putative [Tetrahymena thermophila SB210]|eukprot:XP_012652085.1 transmembrane protein, putative [Tetrahymena thermophila SB210]
MNEQINKLINNQSLLMQKQFKTTIKDRSEIETFIVNEEKKKKENAKRNKFFQYKTSVNINIQIRSLIICRQIFYILNDFVIQIKLVQLIIYFDLVKFYNNYVKSDDYNIIKAICMFVYPTFQNQQRNQLQFFDYLFFINQLTNQFSCKFQNLLIFQFKQLFDQQIFNSKIFYIIRIQFFVGNLKGIKCFLFLFFFSTLL